MWAIEKSHGWWEEYNVIIRKKSGKILWKIDGSTASHLVPWPTLAQSYVNESYPPRMSQGQKRAAASG